MNVAGFEEALASSVSLTLEDSLSVRVASLPGLTLLKLIAWSDGGRETNKDAADLYRLLTTYADAGASSFTGRSGSFETTQSVRNGAQSPSACDTAAAARLPASAFVNRYPTRGLPTLSASAGMPPKSAAIPNSQLVRMFDVLPTSLLGGVLGAYTFEGDLRRTIVFRAEGYAPSGYYVPRSLGMSSGRI